MSLFKEKFAKKPRLSGENYGLSHFFIIFVLGQVATIHGKIRYILFDELILTFLTDLKRLYNTSAIYGNNYHSLSSKP
jgi:hypothetical protein